MTKNKNIYAPKLVEIKEIWQENDTTKTFRLNHKIKHDPGQFLELSLFKFGEAPVSISSHSKDFVDFTVRSVGRVTNALHRLKIGDYVGVRGPYGKGYPMDRLEGKDIILTGGGCGVAPLRSVIHYLEKNKNKFGEIDLFLGYRTPKEVLFKRELPSWEKKFNVYLTVDKPLNKSWKHDIGLVTKLFEKKKINPKNKCVLTCGPPAMIKFVIKTLKEKKGFFDEQIYISLERRMKCGFGKCGHCMIKEKFVCLDGPVFNYSESKFLED